MKKIQNLVTYDICCQLMELCFTILSTFYKNNQIVSIQINSAINSEIDDDSIINCNFTDFYYLLVIQNSIQRIFIHFLFLYPTFLVDFCFTLLNKCIKSDLITNVDSDLLIQNFKILSTINISTISGIYNWKVCYLFHTWISLSNIKSKFQLKSNLKSNDVINDCFVVFCINILILNNKIFQQAMSKLMACPNFEHFIFQYFQMPNHVYNYFNI